MIDDLYHRCHHICPAGPAACCAINVFVLTFFFGKTTYATCVLLYSHNNILHH